MTLAKLAAEWAALMALGRDALLSQKRGRGRPSLALQEQADLLDDLAVAWEELAEKASVRRPS